MSVTGSGESDPQSLTAKYAEWPEPEITPPALVGTDCRASIEILHWLSAELGVIERVSPSAVRSVTALGKGSSPSHRPSESLSVFFGVMLLVVAAALVPKALVAVTLKL